MSGKRETNHFSPSLIIGYYEEGNSFGIWKKGKYKPAADFGFEFLSEVICEDPHSSGFMIALTPDRDEHSDAPPCTRYTLPCQMYNYSCLMVGERMTATACTS